MTAYELGTMTAYELGTMTAYELGQVAFGNNKGKRANPFTRYTQDFEEWEAGWVDCYNEWHAEQRNLWRRQ